MGYYTRYELETIPATRDIHSLIKDKDKYENIINAVSKNGESNDSCKWYDHEGEMIELSIEYPDLIFKLRGEGEENTDIWVKYFKNGKIQVKRAQIVIPEFSENYWVNFEKGKY